VVLGVHGAALANVVFSPPGASLIEVAMPEPEVSRVLFAAALWLLV
jgi:capsular polysaccharide biosynthesis protein